jgi:hypothetical protein
MGSDDLNLRVLSQSSDDEKERAQATKVLKLLARGRHWVLVVLLLGNVVSRTHRISCAGRCILNNDKSYLTIPDRERVFTDLLG